MTSMSFGVMPVYSSIFRIEYTGAVPSSFRRDRRSSFIAKTTLSSRSLSRRQIPESCVS